MRAVDLFAGAGGTTTGATWAGARGPARVLALLDGRAHPRVTRDDAEHTAGLAERAGLAVTRETWR